MLEWLDSSISLNSLIWLYLAAFMLHDFEEIIRIEPWFRKNVDVVYGKVPAAFRPTVQTFSQVTTSQFAIAVCLEFIIFLPVTFMAAERHSYLLFLGFNAVMLLHVFMHLGQAWIVNKLVPGVITAVAITLPYSLYLFSRLLREGIIDWHDIWISLPYGFLLLPIVWLGHLLGEKLMPRPAKK
ncbi:HXXEE domain-containing protein [Paenibacillus allorhizosphaerae]|uniref:HXXEE domain-containing protein n=1 Tax=Paenibacillus allorhizosphaerae TaxID=2849866 RepID=A0ABM8VGK4_9BACL|nr:HXXEE domain-containing protein [Paenibacillus allorhizosphaerae]CAG7638750.1 hypothetical protein PAECIP111802_02472 [Paenibacillus allorhizosphaerae]